MRLDVLLLAALLAAPASTALAQDAQVAVAANFTEAARELADAFQAATGQEIALSFGATGQFYTQITQGAPFAAFLSADDSTPARLAEEGFAVPESRFTYAIGRLVLFSTEDGRVTGPESLEADFSHLSIAEPAVAPYGAAAIETLDALGLTETLRPRFVVGQNISQTYQFVDTGNAELGFVALSQVIHREDGSHWLVEEEFHAPIRQDAVLLAGHEDNAAASGFLEFLKSPEAHTIIERYGYSVETP